MPDGDLWKYLAGSGALTTILLLLIQQLVKLVENRTTIRAARRQQEAVGGAAQEMRDAQWNSAYRRAASEHVAYDVAMQIRVERHESLINELRVKAGLPPIIFPPLPEAPSLFPELRTEDSTR